MRDKRSSARTLLFVPPAASGCVITGGTFYPPTVVSMAFPPQYQGDYFFTDFCNGWIRKLDADGENTSGFTTGERACQWT
jgi:hypothetical protein